MYTISIVMYITNCDMHYKHLMYTTNCDYMISIMPLDMMYSDGSYVSVSTVMLLL